MSRSLLVKESYIEEVKNSYKLNGFSSQKQLAESLGISRETVNKFLNGNPVDYSYFVDICEKLALDWKEISDFKIPEDQFQERRITRTLNCLCYEDERSDFIKIKTYFETAWNLISKNISTNNFINDNSQSIFENIEIKHFSKPLDVITEISSNLNNYQLFIVDLLYENPDSKVQENVGINMMQLAREYNTNLGIIGISNASQSKNFPGLRNQFEKSARLAEQGSKGTYGYKFIQKVDLLQTGNINLTDLAEIITNVLIDAKIISYDQSASFSSDIKFDPNNSSQPKYYLLQDIVEKIGQENLQELVGHFAKESQPDLTVHYVAPGWSGAAVLRITGSSNLLLKISSSKGSLQRELDRLPKPGQALRDDFPSYIDKEGEPVKTADGEWYAIASQFNTDAITMTDRIRDEENSEKVQDLMYELFVNGLKRSYDQSISQDKHEQQNVFKALFSSLNRTARIHLAIQNLGFLAKRYSKLPDEDVFDSNLLTDYLNHEKIKVGSIHEEEIKGFADLCLSHGDLHGRNVLVSKRGARLRLIDPAECSPRHWAYDIARFFVDLIVSLWDDRDYFRQEYFGDPKITNAHEWTNFNEWRKLSKAFVTWQSMRGIIVEENLSPPNLGVLAALEWCHENLQAIHGNRVPESQPGWEFQLAVAIEFMRSAYREHLPTPKRVLGLVAACDTLRICEKSLAKQLRKN